MLLAHDLHGEGPALVLIHGITECRRVWEPLVGALAEGHRVVNVDLRGHGDSPMGDRYDPVTLATDVVETLDAVGVTTPLVIGHSLGGIVATALAAIARPRAVVNIDQSLRLAGFQEALAPLEPMLRGDRASFDTAMALVFGQLTGPLADDEVQRLDALRRAEPEVVLGVWGAVFDSTAAELDAAVDTLAAAVTAPYLSLHGLDPGSEYTSWLRARIPSAAVEVWPEQGHYPHLVHPARFLERMHDFEQLSTAG